MSTTTTATPVLPSVKDGRVNWTNQPALIAALKERAEQKRIEDEGKKAETRRKELDALIEKAMGGATEVIVRGVVAVKVCNGTSRITDNKMLDEMFSEASAACVSFRPYTYLKVNF